VCLLFIFFLAAGSLSTAYGQTWAQIANNRLVARVGVDGQIDSINVAGRFVVIDPDTGGFLLVPPFLDSLDQHQLGSYLTVRIDGGAAVGGWDLIFGDVGPPGQTGLSQWSEPPRRITNYIRAVWETISDGTTATPPPITVELRLTLVYDVACYEFTVINNDSRAHSIGLRFGQNYSLPGANHEGPIITPNTGGICVETSLIGSQVPVVWRQVSDDLASTVGAMLRPISGAGPPNDADRFVVGNATGTTGITENGTQNLWDVSFTNDPTFNFCTDPWDVSAAAFFNPRQYVPGERKTFTTCFGKARTTIDFTPPWAAGLDGPFSLRYDSSAPAGQRIVPYPFTIRAFVQNLTDTTLTNVSARINLPIGLELAPNESDTKTIPSVSAQSEATFNWSVRANGQTSGRLNYSVSFSAGPGVQGKVVTRAIDVPAVPTITFPGILQKVSFPFQFADPDPSTALGIPSTDYVMVRWNALSNAYETVTRIVPGEGYWLALNNQTTLNLQGASPVNTGISEFQFPLRKNWNQIGNPYLLRVRWADVRVLNTNPGDQDFGRPLPINVASDAQHRWILPTIYRYDVDQKVYKWDADFSSDLVPFVGYWVKALRPNIILLIPPPSGKAAIAGGGRTKAAPARTHNDWQLRIVASDGASNDSWNFIGVAPDASNGDDLKDVEKPPAIQGSVSVGIVRKDGEGRSVVYAQDIQAAGGKKQWNLVVTSPKPNTDVTLSWPEIGALPRGYELFVTDPATNTRRLMRQTSSIRVNTGETASRALVITGEPRGAAGAFRITNWNVTTAGRGPNSSARISFTASGDANVNVRIVGGTGRTVRHLVTRAVSAGNTTVLWDYRDSKGVAVPAGTYIIEIKGTTTNGESARVVIPHTKTR